MQIYILIFLAVSYIVSVLTACCCIWPFYCISCCLWGVSQLKIVQLLKTHLLDEMHSASCLAFLHRRQRVISGSCEHKTYLP